MFGEFERAIHARVDRGEPLFAQRILAGEPGARERYLDMLRAGGSDYPYELVKRAGVDLAQPAPCRALAARINDLMDRIEAILAKQHG
jgi:oligoendopeptidase F